MSSDVSNTEDIPKLGAHIHEPSAATTVFTSAVFLQCASLVFRRYFETNLIPEEVAKQLDEEKQIFSRPAICLGQEVVYALMRNKTVLATIYVILANTVIDAELIPSHEYYPQIINSLLQRGQVMEYTAFAADQTVRQSELSGLINAIGTNHDQLEKTGDIKNLTRVMLVHPDHAHMYVRCGAEKISETTAVTAVNNAMGVLLRIPTGFRLPFGGNVINQIDHTTWREQIFQCGPHVEQKLANAFKVLGMRQPSQMNAPFFYRPPFTDRIQGRYFEVKP